jgi:hypothetical protein
VDWPSDGMSDFEGRDLTFSGITKRVLVSGAARLLPTSGPLC